MQRYAALNVGTRWTPFQWWLFGLASALVCVLTGQLLGTGGILDAHYTDHLRHMAEGALWNECGFSLYVTPFSVVERLTGLGEEHMGQWTTEPTVVPPLTVWLHLPFALLERAGTISPSTAHRLVGVLLAAGAGLTLVLTARAMQLDTHRERSRLAMFALVVAPLILGTGLNGFPDVLFFACAAGALVSMRNERWAQAVLAWSLCGALHFRAGVFLPLALVSIAALWKSESRWRFWAVLATALAIVLPAVIAAATVLGKTHFENVNPISFTRFKPRVLVFATGALTLVLWSWRRNERLVSLTVLASALLAMADPHHAYWHSYILLVPLLVIAARPNVDRQMLMATTVYALAGTALAYVYRATPWWQWVVDVIRGH